MQTLTLSHDNHIAIITLSRPHKKNAMNFVMMQELIKTARHIKADKSVRAVIITGGADFCSGLDLAVFGSPKNMIFATKELIKPARTSDCRGRWRMPWGGVTACHGGGCTYQPPISDMVST